MNDNLEFIGKVWGKNGTQEMIYIDDTGVLSLVSNDDYQEILIDYTNEIIMINTSNQYRGEYKIDCKEDKLIIKGDSASSLIGEWQLLNDESITPINITGEIDFGINESHWMSQIESSRSLKDICIPATHDSAAYKMQKTFFAPWTLTQSADFMQQLRDGIRAFDLRLSENMDFFHGKFYLSQNLRSCLNTMVEFLNQNPSEAIIITVKPENCKDISKFINNFRVILAEYATYFYTGSYIPNLGEVRKKIVLLRRFKFNCGINMLPWLDNTTFNIYDTKNTRIQIQDKYNTSYSDKIKCILQDFANAGVNHSLMYITHFSLQSSGNQLSYVANEVQNMFIKSEAWESMNTKRYIGIYPFDFYKKPLVLRFIYTNFNHD